MSTVSSRQCLPQSNTMVHDDYTASLPFWPRAPFNLTTHYSTSSIPILDASASNTGAHGNQDSTDGIIAEGSANCNPRLPASSHLHPPVSCSALPEPPHVASMAKLRVFLSDELVVQPMTVRDIRHRYILWKSTGVLEDLRSDDMSNLIRLLGTLSTSESGRPHDSPHVHPRAFNMAQSTFVPHWDLIERIGQDKRWLRYPLLPSDHYWLMRAALARFSGIVHASEEHLRFSIASSLTCDTRTISG